MAGSDNAVRAKPAPEADRPLRRRNAIASCDSVEHTLAQLAHLDLLIRRAVLRLRRQQPARADDEFRGLYISDADVDSLLGNSAEGAALRVPSATPDARSAALELAIAAAERRIATIEVGARERGAELRLDRVVRLFELSAFEQQVLLVCLAAEFDLKYERLYAYLQDDVTKKRPTVDLALRLLCTSLDARLAARDCFGERAPLRRWELLTLHDDPTAHHPVLPARAMQLDERLAGFLFGSDAVAAGLAPLITTVPAADNSSSLGQIAPQLRRWCDNWPWDGSQQAPVMLFHGRYGSGRRGAVACLAASLGRPLLMLDADLAAGDPSLSRLLLLAEREALLRGALLCWYQADRFLRPDPGRPVDQQTFMRALARGRVPTVLLAEHAWEPARSLEQRPFLRLELPDVTPAERQRIWAGRLDGASPRFDDAHLTALAARYRLSPGQIADAMARASTLAWGRDPAGGHITANDVDLACRTQAQTQLGTLARKLTPRYHWDDIVLPQQQLTTLHLISTMIRQRSVVYGDWGFDNKLAAGKGVVALFAGPSGTGKTMAAEIIAHDLGLDVFRIDLSAVVNKYIGETEKNLERLFSEAQDSDSILFFDEADALFGKRSAVSDAHDRYANIETAYLLQRTEEYNGLVILASNFPKNVDEAFVRRLHFTINFPAPEEAERLELWRRTFPPEAPRSDDLDLPFLARKLKITGGNIRNIILAAAFVAAEEGSPISMRHLIRATGYEFQKMGKMLLEADFGPYLELVRSDDHGR